MKTRTFSRFLALTAVTTALLAIGCGGSGSGSGGNNNGGGNNAQGAGSYKADFTRSGDTQTFLALQSDGTGSFIYFDVTGTYSFAHLEGDWNFGENFTWTGTDGTHDVSLSGTVSGNPPVFNGEITGPFNTSFAASQFANGSVDLFTGTWETFSSHSDSVWQINQGGVTFDSTLSNGQITATTHATGSIDRSGYFVMTGTKTTNGHTVDLDGPLRGIFIVGPELFQCHIYFQDLAANEQGVKG